MKTKKWLNYLILLLIVVIPVVYADESNCSGILGTPDNPKYTAYWIQTGLTALKYAAIIALIVLSSVDYIKAIASQDSDALKKSNMTFVKRLVYCVIIFFTPTVIKFILSFVGAYGTCGIS